MKKSLIISKKKENGLKKKDNNGKLFLNEFKEIDNNDKLFLNELKAKFLLNEKKNKKVLTKLNDSINKNIDNKSILINYLLELLMIIKVYHWNTHSYSTHKATDELYDRLNKNIDRFVEVMLGKKGQRLNMKGKVIIFTDPRNTEKIHNIINFYKDLLELKIHNFINMKRDSDLLTIRDEILADLNQFLYLLTLN
jgi:DNA-binding ferritin-like protein